MPHAVNPRRLALLLLPVLAFGFTRSSAAADPAAAMLPDGDAVFRFDFAAARQSPAAQALKPGSPAAGETSALSDEAVAALIGSLKFGEPEADSENRPGKLDSLKGVMAAVLVRPLAPDELADRIAAWLAHTPYNASITQTELDGADALTVTPADPELPVIHAAAADCGGAVLLAFRAECLRSALQRLRARDAAPMPTALAEIDATLPSDAQFRLSLIAPESLRNEIRRQLSGSPGPTGANPAAALLGGFAAPFQNLRSLALALRFADTVQAVAALDLSGEQEALQAATLLQSMILPILTGTLAQQNRGHVPEALRTMKARSSGSSLRLSCTLDEKDVADFMRWGAAAPLRLAPPANAP